MTAQIQSEDKICYMVEDNYMRLKLLFWDHPFKKVLYQLL